MKILLIDDHKLIKIGIKVLLEDDEKISVIDDCASKTEFLEKITFYVAVVLYTDIVKILILLIISIMILI